MNYHKSKRKSNNTTNDNPINEFSIWAYFLKAYTIEIVCGMFVAIDCVNFNFCFDC